MVKRDYREGLHDELGARKGRNPHYSLRAFARDLGISPTALSDVMKFKRHLSAKNMDRVSEALGLSPEADAQMRGQALGMWTHMLGESTLQLEEDQFQHMSDWTGFAILNLAKVRGQRWCKDWVAERLGIDCIVAETMMERLRRLGLLKCVKGKMVRTEKNITTTREVPSRALRAYHHHLLAKASDSIRECTLEERNITAMTLSFDPRRMDEAKELITKFRRDFDTKMESVPGREVYTLAIQFFPLSKKKKKEPRA